MWVQQLDNLSRIEVFPLQLINKIKPLNSLSNKEKLRSKLSELSSKRNTKHKDAFTEVKKEEFLKKEKEREEALKEKKRLQNRRKRQNRKERERNNKKNKEVESEFLELKEKNVSNE